MSADLSATAARRLWTTVDGDRNRIVLLNWNFTLFERGRLPVGEVFGEAVKGLITQRSQVQILPPLPVKRQLRGPFVDKGGRAFDVVVGGSSADK